MGVSKVGSSKALPVCTFSTQFEDQTVTASVPIKPANLKTLEGTKKTVVKEEKGQSSKAPKAFEFLLVDDSKATIE